MLVSLYTSRIILQTLGVEDFGIYNVVGGVVGGGVGSSVGGGVGVVVGVVVGVGEVVHSFTQVSSSTSVPSLP